MTDDNRVVCSRGLRHTIAGGIVFDAEQLRADLCSTVKRASDEARADVGAAAVEIGYRQRECKLEKPGSRTRSTRRQPGGTAARSVASH